ncbi:hypothetical protein RPW65_08000 [Pseudomonas sp. NyZ704]|nr:hypothetical protein RPW65_08000 [Pseudomonas sp. NyZ704]
MEYQQSQQTSLTLPLSRQELALLEGFRRLDEQAKQDLLRLVRALLGLPA